MRVAKRRYAIAWDASPRRGRICAQSREATVGARLREYIRRCRVAQNGVCFRSTRICVSHSGTCFAINAPFCGDRSTNDLVIENITFVEFNMVTAQHLQAFVTEGLLLMVLALVDEIPLYRLRHGLAHRERTVPALPLELAFCDFALFIDPPRRVRLDQLDRI